MADKNEESLTGGWSENTKETRKGSFNPTQADLDKATAEFVINGGRIKTVVPEWKKDYENFVNLPVDMSGGSDVFLMGM